MSPLILFAIAMLACPIGMGLMMWLMMRNSHSQPDQNTGQKPANPAERLAALRTQRQTLEAEIAETARIVELETKRDALRATQQPSLQDDASAAVRSAH